MRKIEYVHFGVVIVHEIDEEDFTHRLVAPSEDPILHAEGLWSGYNFPAILNARQVDFEGRMEKDESRLVALVPVSRKPPEQKKKEKKS